MNTMFDIQDNVLIKYTGSEAEVIIPEGITKIEKRAFAENARLVTVKMPDSVTEIEHSAFEKCTKLKNVEFSKNLESISFDAFCGCKALKEVTLPDTLRYLGGSAFASCDKLQKVHCNSQVFEPGNDPFSGYDKKTPPALVDKQGFLIFLNVLFKFVDSGDTREVIVPKGVTHIGGNVFRSGIYSWETKNNIERVVLPSSVKHIGMNAFINCAKLKSIEMPAGVEVSLKAFHGCKSLGDENGLFIHDGTVLGYYGDGDTVNIPAGTKRIAQDIFSVAYDSNPGSKNIRCVNLPEGLEEIGANAFNNCNLLERIVIPESVHTIGNSAFAGCDNLSEVILPQKIEKMGSGVFSGCRRLCDENGFVIFNQTLYGFYGGDREVEVPEGVTEIAGDCFKKMGILKVVLPSTLKILGSAFNGCDLLEEIVIPEGVETVTGRCFSGCSHLRKAVLPSTLKRIHYAAFSDCAMLEEIVLPDGVEVIDSNAFFGCKSIKEVRIPAGVKVLGPAVFQGCEALETLVLPETLEKIGYNCFRTCRKLEEVTIPASVTNIEYDAFSDCSALKKLNYHAADAETHPSAFSGCPALADEKGLIIIGDILWKYIGPGGNVVVPEGITKLMPNVFREGGTRIGRSYVSFRTAGQLKTLNLPSTIKEIGAYALAGCPDLKQLELPIGLETIGEGAFSQSGLESLHIPETVTALDSSLFEECELLKDVTMPEQLRSIGSRMFYGCTALKSVRIPAGVEYIGEDAFCDCKSLKNIEVAQDNAFYAARDGMLVSKAGDALLLCPAGKNLAAYEIPEDFVTIGRHAFISCGSLKKIVIPASVQNIGDEAFPRRDWRGTRGLEIIEADPKAGGGTIGEDIFAFTSMGDKPLLHPKLPIGLVAEQSAQMLLCLAFCMNPEKYEGEYAEIYEKYAKSHEKSLMKKADSLKLLKVAEYFSTVGSGSSKKKTVNYKKLSEQAKVEMLEQAILKNDLAEAKAVIAGCGSFEFTARPLALACLFGSLEMVKTLVENGATFAYEYSAAMKRKYGAAFATNYSQYPVRYSSLIAKTDINPYNPMLFASTHEYHFGTLPKLPKKENTGAVRADIAEFLLGQKQVCFNAAEAMSCAILWGCTELAERLKNLGVPLHVTAVQGLTNTAASAERNECMLSLPLLSPEKCLYALKTFTELLAPMGKKIILIQKSFEEKNSSLLDGRVLGFVFSDTDTSKLTKSKLLELVIAKDDVQALAVMVDCGVLRTTTQRDKAIQYAMDNKKTQTLSWLMDYKNKTADLAAEAAKKEAKELRELMEDPNSVSALKKIWSYKKLEDGTLQITSYKGNAEEVEIPAMIGKAKVTSIGAEAFSASEFGRAKNWKERKNIKRIVIPKGVREIGASAFNRCESLHTLVVPASVEKIALGAFNGCQSLRDKNGCIIINDVLYAFSDPTGKWEHIVIPEGVKKIGDSVLKAEWSSSPGKRVKSMVLPESLEVIGQCAFEGLSALSSIRIPAGVKTIEAGAFLKTGLETVEFSEGVESIGEAAFAVTKLQMLRLPKSLVSIGKRALYNCPKLRDLYIPATLTDIGEELLGNYGDPGEYSWSQYRPNGVYVYTPAGSAAEEHMKNYVAVYVSNEYEEE